MVSYFSALGSSQLSFLLCITGENNSCPFLCFFLIHPLIVIYYILFILFLQVFGKDFLFNKKRNQKMFLVSPSQFYHSCGS
ncbi:hypothetical protein CON32_27740 [Bacillus cereus]|nr:hypothetical protein CON32_27740 [Bacillus cereus]